MKGTSGELKRVFKSNTAVRDICPPSTTVIRPSGFSIVSVGVGPRLPSDKDLTKSRWLRRFSASVSCRESIQFSEVDRKIPYWEVLP